MTEHPGLGSGALREALEKHEYMNGSCLCREFRLPPYGKKELDEWALVRGDWMRDIRWKYWLEHVLAALSLSSPIEPAPAAGKGPTETLIRMFLWQGHGHEGIYGDDCEMQCGECGVDYKRDSLQLCVEKARVAALQTGLAKLAQPTPQASSEIRERVRQERVLVLEDVITRLQERMGNEEYGHAKAAVALDIEAVEEMKAEAERSLGDWTQHHLHVQPSSDCHLCRALAPSRQGAAKRVEG